MRRRFAAVVLALLPALAALGASLADEELWDAARRGDLEAVTRLLASGVDVNAKTRYGATALFFACGQGRVDVVRLLLDKGADPNAKDTFYGATPLNWAVNHGSSEIALLLVRKGADSPADALEVAVKNKDARLVEAVLERGPLDPAVRSLNRARAREGGAAEIAALLEKAAVRPEPPVTVTPEGLASFAGAYRDDEAKVSTDVVMDTDGLLMRIEGKPLRLVPIGERRFRGPEGSDTWIEFGGSGGAIEYLRAQQGASRRRLGRVTTPPAAAAAPTPAPNPPAALSAGPRQAAAPWPSFRGPSGSGIADGQGAPGTWDVPEGRNVRWKTPLPGIANSSPVVWGDRVFVTTAVSSKADTTFRTGLYGDVDSVDDVSTHTFRLLALDRKTGRVLWERTAEERAPTVKRHLKSSLANPSPTTDGKRVVVLFATGGLHAYDVDGRLLWEKDLGVLDSGWFYDRSYQWGFGSSPVIDGDRVIVQADIQKGSFLAAFDLATGREAWRTERDEIPTWGTPAVVHGDAGDEVVTNGPTVRGYDAKTGALRWSLKPNSEVTVATPVVGEGLVFVTAGYPPARPIYAIRPGARGDLSLPEGKTSSDAIAWSSPNDGTYIPTPLVYRGLLYTLANNGRLSCYDAKTGELRYRARVGQGGSFSASPVAADGRLYVTSEDGDVSVVKAGASYELLGTNRLGEVVLATPAISDGLMVFRTLKQVVAVGE
jgi:outer membrane protein assembly factor BamB